MPSVLIEVLVIFNVNDFTLLRATAPNNKLSDDGVNIGYGLLPDNASLAVPPSEPTVTLSANVPKTVGLNFTVNSVLSPPATAIEVLVAVKAVVFVVMLLIVSALIDVFLKYAVIVAESPFARFAKAREVVDRPKTGAGLVPLRGTFTNVVAELLWRYTVSV